MIKNIPPSDEIVGKNSKFNKPHNESVIKLKKMLTQKDLKLRELKEETWELLNELDSAYKELRRTQEDLILKEKLNMAGGLASGIGHEIRDTLNFITMSVQHLHGKYSPGDERREFTEAILDKLNALNNIAFELIRFSRPHVPIFRKMDIHELLDRVCNLVKFKCILQKVKVIKVFADDLSPIMIDSELIEQVILNLFDNSLWAMPEGGTLTATTRLIDRKNFIEIQILDTGCGVSKSHFSRIFDPFFSQKENGAGLGLSIVKRIIEEHRGCIKVDSHLSKGTSFSIELPIVQHRTKRKANQEAQKSPHL